MQVSKWLEVQALIDAEEMEALFEALGDFSIYLAGALTPLGEGIVTKPQFLSVYKKYVDGLKIGQLPHEEEYRSLFSSVFSVNSECLYAIPFDNGKQLIRLLKPAVQLQAHSMDYTVSDGKFRPMVFGVDSILWGIQFSYPQLYLDPTTKEVLQVRENVFFPNSALFHALQKWMRHNTIPTPFLVEDKKINVPMRLGKQCLRWIQNHPQLAIKNLRVLTT
jgi:hypothetical protein